MHKAISKFGKTNISQNFASECAMVWVILTIKAGCQRVPIK